MNVLNNKNKIDWNDNARIQECCGEFDLVVIDEDFFNIVVVDNIKYCPYCGQELSSIKLEETDNE